MPIHQASAPARAPGSFDMSTRRRTVSLGVQSKGAVNPLRYTLPKVGFLAGLAVTIRGSVAGTLSAPNAAGFSSVIRRIRVIPNGGLNLIDLSGPQYFWLIENNLNEYNAMAGSSGRTAVTATTFVLDLYLPISLNSRDPIGLFALQNPQTNVDLEIEFETDSVVATGATVTATVEPQMIYFSVPSNPADWPSLRIAHQILGESRVISAAGELDYYLPRGNTYVAAMFGAYINAATPADSWSAARLILNQSDVIYDQRPGQADIEYTLGHGRARVLGTVPFDFIGTVGLGTLGGGRDLLSTGSISELMARITLSAAGTLQVVRRQLVDLPGVM